MGMLVDIRKHNLDNLMNELLNSSIIKKNWLGRIKDNYWTYLEQSTVRLKIDLDTHVLTDLLTYFFNEKNIKDIFHDHSLKLSVNRGSSVFLFILDDKEKFLQVMELDSFLQDFEKFCRKLNGSYYTYNPEQLNQSILEFKRALDEIDEDYGIIINIG